MSLAFNLPINSVSFGQISTLILRELFKSNKETLLIPIGNPDLSTQSDISQQFTEWIQNAINESLVKHSKKNKIFILRHIN